MSASRRSTGEPLRLGGLASPRVLSVFVCLALAALSLLLPLPAGADPWAWTIWGREAAALHLDTTGGPSWKPLPVIFTIAFSPFGDAALALWLLVARAGGLLALVLAYRLVARLALPGHRSAGIVGGVAAAVGLLLVPDWITYLAQGYSEPLVVACALGAVERHLDGRPVQALALAFLAALARPETWPFLGLYGLFLWVRQPSRRVLLVGLALALGILWFVPDWLGSGSPFYGSTRARAQVSVSRSFLEAAGGTLGIVVAPAWIAATGAVVWALRRRRYAVIVLAAAAVAWLGLVVVMSAAGYPGLDRLMIPGAAFVCVLAGVGATRFVGLPARVAARAGMTALVAAAVAPFAVAALPGLGEMIAEAREQDGLERDLKAAVAGSGISAPPPACAAFFVDGWPRRPGMGRQLAWSLDLPLHDVELLRGSGTRSLRRVRAPGVLFSPAGSQPEAVPPAGLTTRTLARSGDWRVVAVSGPDGPDPQTCATAPKSER